MSIILSKLFVVLLYFEYLYPLQLIERKIAEFSETADIMASSEHYDAQAIGRDTDMLKKKWSVFHTSVRDYQILLDKSVFFYTLIDEVVID